MNYKKSFLIFLALIAALIYSYPAEDQDKLGSEVVVKSSDGADTASTPKNLGFEEAIAVGGLFATAFLVLRQRK